MYPGANNTELCPTRFFTGEPLYREGRAPDEAEIARRCERYWRPYHDALAAELARLKAAHGHVVLFDGHSIKSELPWLFEGRLPDLNLGTRGRRELRAVAARRARRACSRRRRRFTHVVDGRFKGGYITRHYGRPARRRARGAARDVLALLHGRDAAVPASTPRARRACSRCCARWCETMLDWRPRDDD